MGICGESIHEDHTQKCFLHSISLELFAANKTLCEPLKQKTMRKDFTFHYIFQYLRVNIKNTAN